MGKVASIDSEEENTMFKETKLSFNNSAINFILTSLQSCSVISAINKDSQLILMDYTFKRRL